MTIYLVNIFLITVYAMFMIYSPQANKSSRKWFIILATLQWILLSGLRATTVGADTLNYKRIFESDIKMSWKEIFLSYKNIYLLGQQGKDAGYISFEKFCSYFSQNYQIFLIIIAVIFFVCMGYSIYQNSRDPYISFLIYSCLFFAFFSITGNRQTIATALAVFLGYEFIKKRKFLPFLILVLIATTIHKSAIIFLLMYPLYSLDISRKTMGVALIAIVLSFIFSSQMYDFFSQLSGYYFSDYIGEKADLFLLSLVAVTLFSYVYREKLSDSTIVDKETPHYVIAVITATFFCTLLLSNPNGMRVVQYFSLFLLFLIPEYIAVFPEDNRIIVWIAFVCLILLLFVKNHPVYHFFWQVS